MSADKDVSLVCKTLTWYLCSVLLKQVFLGVADNFQKRYFFYCVKRMLGLRTVATSELGIRQCCGSGMFIPDPGSWFLLIPDPGSRIPDPKTGTKESGETKLLSYLFCSHRFHKIVNYFIFEMLKKKKCTFQPPHAPTTRLYSIVDFNGTYLLTTVGQEELWILHMHIALVEKLPLTTSGSPVR